MRFPWNFRRQPRTETKQPRKCRPAVEALESRLAPATITVLDDVRP